MDFMSPYLKNSIFSEMENQWNDENSIYQQNHTVGCYPINRLLPDNIASSRFENLGIPIGLVYYDTRPVYYVSKQFGGDGNDEPDDDDDVDGDEKDKQQGGNKESHQSLTTLNMHQTGGKLWFDELVGGVIKEFGTSDTSRKTKKNIYIFGKSTTPNKTRKLSP